MTRKDVQADRPNLASDGPRMEFLAVGRQKQTLRMRFVDPDFLGLDTHVAITGTIAAVAWTIERIREVA